MANSNWRVSTVRVPEGFPLKPGETLRIHYPGTRRETRVVIGLGKEEGKSINFLARSYSHDVGTNKESISLVGNERKLRRV
jgi:hypothetical protein